MSARSIWRMGALVLVALLPLGCFGSDDQPPPPPPPAPPRPPSVDSIQIADWPPLGRQGTITARCSDDSNLTQATAIFQSRIVRPLSGVSQSVVFPAMELGEGMGALRIVCCDSSSTCTERQVANLVIDLSPPQIELDRIVASPTGEGFEGQIGVWIRDAWVLGSVELTFRGTTLRHELPKAYPSTLGNAWDVTRVGFPAKELPPGAGTAVVVAHDAAGNTSTKEIPIRVDGIAPTVSIVEPANGAVASNGRITVRLSAADADNPTPPTIELLVGGAPVAELTGPNAQIQVDTSTLPSGPTEIRAVARDDAGNRSVQARITVQVP